MSNVAQVAALARFEEIIGIPAEDLSCRLKEEPGIGDQPRCGEPGIVDAVFAAHQIPRRKWTIRPRQHMVVQYIDLSKRGAHLAGGRRVRAAEARVRKQRDAGHEAKASNLLGSEQGELGELLR